MIKINRTIKLFVAAVLLAGVTAAGYFAYTAFDKKISDFESRLEESARQNEAMDKQLQSLSEAYAGLKERPTEELRREAVKESSQDDLLTAAVGEAAPAVVSIVAAKDVPQFEVVYINPFGDDPFYKDFGIQVPQYRQKGTAEKKVSAGTGFIASANGYIVSNRHVVEDQSARYTVLLADGTQKQAEVIYRDDNIDVAILKIESGNYSTMPLGNSDTLKLGQSVFAVGNALGEYNNSVSVGIISGLNRELEASTANGTEKLKGVIQTDAAINPGNSGGPLVDLNGKVVGVNVAMANAENIGFSIPINTLKSIINSHIK